MRNSERWLPPSLAMGVVATLVLLVLPNPLRIPQNNPAAQAEYAPVPGNEEDAADANFGETNAATSTGIGTGGSGLGEEPPEEPPTPEGGGYSPARHKQCYGDPPRQLPDPLSPPCVSFYDGDNGGSTWHGTDGDEITIVYYNDFGVKGDLSRPYRPSDDPPNYPPYYYTNHVRSIKALLRYFQQHFQTYGRRVRMIGHASKQGLGTPDGSRISDMQLMANMDPFAIVTLIENAQAIGRFAKQFEIPIFGWNEDVPASIFEENAPYVWSFMPDQYTETVWSSEFICRKLRGRPARFTDDPLLLGKPRKFGLLFQSEGDSQRGPFLSQLARELVLGVERACGMKFDVIKSFTANATGSATSMMIEMKQKNITTLVCYCIAQQNELHVPKLQGAATSISYFPEWYWDSTAAMDRTLWQQEYGSPQHKGFGSSYLWRQGRFEDSYAYKAFLEQEPGKTPNLRFNFEMYHTLLSVFSGIQGAGPNLTPETIAQGMFTFGWTSRGDPFIPTGGYGDYGPSPYTFIHSAMGWWYDPTGTPPGRSEPNGCIRVIHGGRRFFGPDWPEGDGDLFKPSDPCTEDTRREI